MTTSIVKAHAARTLALTATVAALPGAGSAAEWSYSATLYGWLTSLSATIGTPLGPVEVEQSFSDILDQLEFAAFGTLEARRGRWGLIADLVHADLSQTRTLPAGAPFGQAQIDTRVTAISGYATYRFAETEAVALDLAAGFRLHDLSLSATLTGPDLRITRSDQWIDPVIGVRVIGDLAANWRGAVSLDAGGFGIGSASDLSWQATAELEYGFSERWSAIVGYRHLSIDRPTAGRDLKLEISGPVVGVRARF